MEKMELTKNSKFIKFWKNKKILITGCNGFKGSWLSFVLYKLGAKVSGFGLNDQKKINLFKELGLKKKIKFKYLDIRNKKNLEKYLKKNKFDFVFHLAAQPLVIEGYKNPVKTFETNILGTLNLLHLINLKFEKKIILNVTTDKVYLKKKKNSGYKEDDELGGSDPYSASKACSEIVSYCFKQSYSKKKGNLISTARAGNVIGGGDWSKNRLIPDIIASWKNKKILKVRNPNSIRPWQHVLDPTFGYMYLVYKMYLNKNYSGSYNFGPIINNNIKVINIIHNLQENLKNFDYNIIKKSSKLKEDKYLNLNSAKAKNFLGFKNKLSIKKSLDMTARWYKNFYDGNKAEIICQSDLNIYLNE